MIATYTLRTDRDRAFAILAVQRATLGQEVVIREPKRSTEQNKRLWSMLGAIVAAKKTLAGREWQAEDWKELLLSAFLRERKMETGVPVMGLSGEYVVLGRLSSSNLTVEQFGDFMASVEAWLANNGIPWGEQ